MIFIPFFVAPLGAAAAAEYALCRFPKRRIWRRLPPILLTAVTAAVTFFRYHGWNEGEGAGAPIETLLFFPGLPALAIAIGLFLGWRLWKAVWSPRVVKGDK